MVFVIVGAIMARGIFGMICSQMWFSNNVLRRDLG